MLNNERFKGNKIHLECKITLENILDCTSQTRL